MALHPGGATHVGGTAPVGPPGCLSSAPSASAWSRTPSRDGGAVPATTARSGGPSSPAAVEPFPKAPVSQAREKAAGRPEAAPTSSSSTASRPRSEDHLAADDARAGAPNSLSWRSLSRDSGGCSAPALGSDRTSSRAATRRHGSSSSRIEQTSPSTRERGWASSSSSAPPPSSAGRGTPAVHATRGRPPLRSPPSPRAAPSSTAVRPRGRGPRPGPRPRPRRRVRASAQPGPPPKARRPGSGGGGRPGTAGSGRQPPRSR